MVFLKFVFEIFFEKKLDKYLLNFNKLTVQQQLFRPQFRHRHRLIMKINHQNRIILHPLPTILLQRRLPWFPIRFSKKLKNIKSRQINRHRRPIQQHKNDNTTPEKFTSQHHFFDEKTVVNLLHVQFFRTRFFRKNAPTSSRLLFFGAHTDGHWQRRNEVERHENHRRFLVGQLTMRGSYYLFILAFKFDRYCLKSVEHAYEARRNFCRGWHAENGKVVFRL